MKQFLRDYLDKEKDELTMNRILQDIGKHYDADRAYIFEMDSGRKVFNNTFEWCREGVTAEIENLQNISIDGLECWFEALKSGESFLFPPYQRIIIPAQRPMIFWNPKGLKASWRLQLW